jgi:hydrogenase nickel incorporation protein HypA/HybF
MHEESLVRSLLHQVEELAQQHHATEVEDIEVEIGPLSGVESLLVREAFERLKDGFKWPNCTLTISVVGLMVFCNQCSGEFELFDYRFVCAHCGSTSLRILSGDAFRLLNVRMQIENAG